LSTPNSSLAYLVVVLVPGSEADPKVTFFDSADPSHTRLKQHKFLVDTGADHSLLQPDKMNLLARPGSFPGIHCTGIAGGPALPIVGAGYLDFVFPGSAQPSRGWVGHVVNLQDESKTRPVYLVAREVHRPSSGPPIMSAKQVADRFNVFDHDAVEAFHLLHPGVTPFKVDRKVDYSNGIIQRAMGRKGPTHSALNQITMSIRLHTRKGEVWWTDISLKHEPDFAGNLYRRIFVEQTTGRVLLYFSKRKDTVSYTASLDTLRTWVLANCDPGTTLRTLRCDFGSEYAKQGHGEDVLVKALRAYQELHPGLKTIPLAPYDQAHNLAENATHLLVGLAFSNSCRAHLGPAAWSIMAIGAAQQLNHRAAARGANVELRGLSRDQALTGRIFDASLVLGYVGQLGWTHNVDGKANVFRPNARSCLYVGPSEEASGQMVYDLDANRIVTVRAVSLGHDPNTVPFVLATSDLYRPAGSNGMPEQSAYTARLHSMLLPGVDPDNLMVVHDQSVATLLMFGYVTHTCAPMVRS
jgi:hypothetical protein